MSTNKRSTKERTAVRPRYISLGIDCNGSHHVYRTVDETIHVIHTTHGRRHVEDIRGRPIEEWMAYVDDKFGWERKQYGVGLAEMAARALEQ